MKRFLTVTFLLWASIAGAQVNLQIPNGGNAATEEWTKQYADGWLKRLLVKPPDDGEPPVEVPDPVDPTTPCTTAPSAPTVSNITTKGIRLAVTAANGISVVEWFVYNTAVPTVNLRAGSRAFATVMDIGWVDELPAGNYGIRIRGLRCTASSNSTFVISNSTPTLDPCSAGPTLISIYDTSVRGVTFQFHGENVTLLRYMVKDGLGNTLRTASVVPAASVIPIAFTSAIPAGSYTLRIEGVNCSGFSEMAFTATGTDIDPGEPPVQPDPATLPCATTPQVSSISNISNKGLRALLDGFDVQIPGTPGTGTPTTPTIPPSFTNWNVGGWSGSVWKPGDYSTSKTYPVVYVHDGSTLYEESRPGDSWNLNNRLQALINAGTVAPCIIVSINTPDRMRTLLPNKPFYAMSQSDQNTIASHNGGTPRADETINFMVNQLKPYIDANFKTKTDRANTMVMGASMGGIFAIYAYSERNDIFGRMAALSPHYQGTLIDVNDNLFTDEMVAYVNTFFPHSSTNGKVYFDRGTTSLDQNYEVAQNQVNTILAGKGYNDSNFKKTVYQGGGHTNVEWGQHVPSIFTFLMPSQTGTAPVIVPSTSINWYVYKTSAPLLYLKQGNTAFAKTLNLSWSGDLPGGDYGLRLQAVNCQGTVSRTFTIPNPVGPIPCASAPSISSINIASKTLLSFVWSGLNVPEIVWNIKQGAATVRSGSFTPGSSQTQTVTYAVLPPGNYDLQLVGLTCTTQNPSVGFTIAGDPVIVTGGKKIIMNLTGYGFDKSQPSGMPSEWVPRIEAFLNLNYQGRNFKGIDGVMVNIKWHEYEPTEGNYDDATMLKIINWCAARGLTVSVIILPYRREGDGMIPDSHKNKLLDGTFWYYEGRNWPFSKTYIPSMNSDIARTKFRACMKHMAAFMKQYNNVDHIALSTAHTEEFQLVIEEDPVMLSGYGDIDKQKWATFSGGKPVPYPSPTTGYEGLWNWPAGKEWGDFHTIAMRDFHREFSRGVREGGMRVSTMYAGVGAPTGASNFSTRLNVMYSARTSDQPDITYSSEGIQGMLWAKLMATDLNMGTFPGSEPSIEFDPDDIANPQTPNPPYGVNLYGNLLYEYSASFFRRGGKIIHMAMAYHPNSIPQLSEALYKLRNEFIESNSGMTPIEQGPDINHTVTGYGGQMFWEQWRAMGGGLNKQIKIRLLPD